MQQPIMSEAPRLDTTSTFENDQVTPKQLNPDSIAEIIITFTKIGIKLTPDSEWIKLLVEDANNLVDADCFRNALNCLSDNGLLLENGTANQNILEILKSVLKKGRANTAYCLAEIIVRFNSIGIKLTPDSEWTKLLVEDANNLGDAFYFSTALNFLSEKGLLIENGSITQNILEILRSFLKKGWIIAVADIAEIIVCLTKIGIQLTPDNDYFKFLIGDKDLINYSWMLKSTLNLLLKKNILDTDLAALIFKQSGPTIIKFYDILCSNNSKLSRQEVEELLKTSIIPPLFVTKIALSKIDDLGLPQQKPEELLKNERTYTETPSLAESSSAFGIWKNQSSDPQTTEYEKQAKSQTTSSTQIPSLTAQADLYSVE